ncbi:MAG: superoxide dismutase [Pseudonocardiales bacterium]|nr:MAG: superoxide dismutase [Pseudonocardiales bacterium]
MVAVTVGAMLCAGAVTAPVSAAGHGHSRDPGYVIAGRRVFPEGVAADGRFVYATSKADGTVYRGAVSGSTLEPFLPGGRDGRSTGTGIKSVGGRLLVAGAETGRFYVYDTATGTRVATYTVPDPGRGTFLNDDAATASGDVYITDSTRPVIYRIPAREVFAHPTGAQRTLQPAITLPAASYTTGVNANGIVATPDGKALLAVYSNSGALYRIDLATGATHRVALDRPLINGDGLLLLGHTLYAARNFDNLLVTVHLCPNYSRGITTAERGYPGADVPTGLALSRGRLLVVNSQFDTLFQGAPLTSPTFTISAVPLR